MYDEQNIAEYLAQDMDNLVFVLGDSATCYTRKQLLEDAKDTTKVILECRPDWKFVGPYLKLSLPNFNVIVPTSQIQSALNNAKLLKTDSSRTFQLKSTNVELPLTASLDAARQEEGSFMSGDHCQSGTSKRVYALLPSDGQVFNNSLDDFVRAGVTLNYDPWESNVRIYLAFIKYSKVVKLLKLITNTYDDDDHDVIGELNFKLFYLVHNNFPTFSLNDIHKILREIVSKLKFDENNKLKDLETKVNLGIRPFFSEILIKVQTSKAILHD